MNIISSKIADVFTIVPETHRDERGFLFESFRDSWLPDFHFVQDNHTRSVKGTVRGLHYQLNQPQGKLIRVVSGEIFDVAVDLRKSSPTFLSWVGKKLRADNHEIFWIPPGFAHGFMVLSNSADLIYRCTDYYAPDDNYVISWKDEEIDIQWPLGTNEPILSEKDRYGQPVHLAPHFS